MKTKRTFYRVIPNPSFSTIHAKTLKKAKKALEDFGNCPNGTPENKAYWKAQQKECRIVKVTEIIEDVEI